MSTQGGGSQRTIRLVYEGVPPSLKNGQQIVRPGNGRPIILKSKAATDAQSRIRRVARAAVNCDGSLFGNNYVGVTITVDERGKRTEVVVEDLGPPPAKGPKNTRRDIHNTADVVMDALQKVVFDDDRQARYVTTRYGEVPA